MTTPSSRTETSSAILAMAIQVLVQQPDATMAEIAAAGGFGRATVYRHFPTRDALMEALDAEALQVLAARIEDAGRDDTTVPQAILRLVRIFLEVSDAHVLLARRRIGLAGSAQAAEMDRAVWAPSRAIFQRGLDDGTFRRGFDAEILSRSLAGIALAAVDAGLPEAMGIDQVSDMVASMFLNGVARRSKAKSKSKSKRATAE